MEKVAIIIPSYNASFLLQNVLKSIERTINYPNYDIIVIDDGGQDDTVKILHDFFPHIKIIKNVKNMGFPISVNRGIREIYADFYFILNNDIIITTKNWLNHFLIEMRKNPRIGILTGMIINIFDVTKTEKTFKRYIELYTKEESNQSTLQYVSNLGAAAILVRRKAFETAGIFNEVFSPGYYEDEDLCNRMQKLGWKLAILKEVEMLHFTSSTFNNVYSKIYLYFYLKPRNRIQFNLIHPSFRKILLEPFLLMKSFGHIVLQDSFTLKKMKLRYLLSALNDNLKFLIRLKKNVQIYNLLL